MPRKTLEVAKLLKRGNALLAIADSSSTLETDAERRALRTGVIALLESALFETDNYKGYRYLASEYLPADEQTEDNVLRPGHDDTRRRYYA